VVKAIQETRRLEGCHVAVRTLTVSPTDAHAAGSKATMASKAAIAERQREVCAQIPRSRRSCGVFLRQPRRSAPTKRMVKT
jgi:hypothetical protein